MSFNLKKTEEEKRNALAGKLREQRETIEAKVVELNAQIQSLLNNELEPLIADYNADMEDARQLCLDIAEARRSEWDDKSETWQEGERGQEVDTFIGEWENVDLPDLDVPDVPEFVVEFAGDDAEILEGLPEDVG